MKHGPALVADLTRPSPIDPLLLGHTTALLLRMAEAGSGDAGGGGGGEVPQAGEGFGASVRLIDRGRQRGSAQAATPGASPLAPVPEHKARLAPVVLLGDTRRRASVRGPDGPSPANNNKTMRRISLLGSGTMRGGAIGAAAAAAGRRPSIVVGATGATPSDAVASPVTTARTPDTTDSADGAGGGTGPGCVTCAPSGTKGGTGSGCGGEVGTTPGSPVATMDSGGSPLGHIRHRHRLAGDSPSAGGTGTGKCGMELINDRPPYSHPPPM
jgi:hypothetical protein